MGDAAEAVKTEAQGDVTQPDQDDPLAGLTAEEAAVGAKILPAIAAAANRTAREHKAKDMARELSLIMEDNKKRMEQVLEDIRKANTPLGPEEVAQLLGQEYLEFSFQAGRNGGQRTFVIRELTIRAEKKLSKVIRTVLTDQMAELSRVDWSGGGLPMLAKVLDTVPGALEALSECVAVCLDPGGEDPAITGEWVQDNIGANRLLNIVNAQVQASRYRDFFSLAYRMYSQQKTTAV